MLACFYNSKHSQTWHSIYSWTWYSLYIMLESFLKYIYLNLFKVRRASWIKIMKPSFLWSNQLQQERRHNTGSQKSPASRDLSIFHFRIGICKYITQYQQAKLMKLKGKCGQWGIWNLANKVLSTPLDDSSSLLVLSCPCLNNFWECRSLWWMGEGHTATPFCIRRASQWSTHLLQKCWFSISIVLTKDFIPEVINV